MKTEAVLQETADLIAEILEIAKNKYSPMAYCLAIKVIQKTLDEQNSYEWNLAKDLSHENMVQ